MDQTLKDANDKAAQAEFVCIDSCHDKDGQLYKPTHLVSPAIFTPTPRSYTSSLTAKLETNSKEGIYQRRIAHPAKEEKNDMSNCPENSDKFRESALFDILVSVIAIFVLLVTIGLFFFGGFMIAEAVQNYRAPVHLDMTREMDKADVDIFFEQYREGEYKLKDTVEWDWVGKNHKIREVIEVPFSKLSINIACFDPPKTFSVARYGVIRHAYCRWIIRDYNSVIRECTLLRKELRRGSCSIFGYDAFCRIDLDWPSKDPVKPASDIMVPSKPVQNNSSLVARLRQAGSKVSGGILFIFKRFARSTKIIYHRTVVTLQELLNLAEPKVQFLGGAAQSFAKEKIWHNMKGGYKKLCKRLCSMPRRPN